MVCEWSAAQTRALDAWADLTPDPEAMKEFLRWDSNSYNGIGVMSDYYRCLGLGLVGDYEHSVMVAPMGPVDRDGRYATNSAKSMKASLRAVVVPEESGYVQKTMLSVFTESKDPDGPRVGQTALHNRRILETEESEGVVQFSEFAINNLLPHQASK